MQGVWEQGCGWPNHSQPESRSNTQAGATASTQWAAALSVGLSRPQHHINTSGDFAKSPSFLEGKRRWGGKQGLQRLTWQICRTLLLFSLSCPVGTMWETPCESGLTHPWKKTLCGEENNLVWWLSLCLKQQKSALIPNLCCDWLHSFNSMWYNLALTPWRLPQYHRIVESLKLEKTSKILNSKGKNLLYFLKKCILWQSAGNEGISGLQVGCYWGHPLEFHPMGIEWAGPA